MKEWKVFFEASGRKANKTIEEYLKDELTERLNKLEQSGWNILNVTSINFPPSYDIRKGFFIIAWKEKKDSSRHEYKPKPIDVGERPKPTPPSPPKKYNRLK